MAKYMKPDTSKIH